jgi:hypothetical protein
MANIQFNGEVLHYIIKDGGDGSAHLKFFASEDALDLYLEKMEENGEYDLTEGGGSITQEDVDNAMTQAEVEQEFA